MSWREYFNRLTSEPTLRERGASVISEEPWVAAFPGFLSGDEADEVIRMGLTEGLRDEDEHPKRIRNVSVTNCDSARCMQNPMMNELSRRVSSLLGAPSRNFESMEFVRYEPGQHYVWHPDEYSWRRRGWSATRTDPVQVLSGPRVLTMFFYLSDVEEGGETGFLGDKQSPPPDEIAAAAAAAAADTKASASKVARPGQAAVGTTLDAAGNAGAAAETGGAKLLVKPQKGKAILWANMQDDWRAAAPAAVHRAFAVRKGIKWASTLWIHAQGFRIPELYAGSACQPPR